MAHDSFLKTAQQMSSAVQEALLDAYQRGREDGEYEGRRAEHESSRAGAAISALPVTFDLDLFGLSSSTGARIDKVGLLCFPCMRVTEDREGTQVGRPMRVTCAGCGRRYVEATI